MGVWPGRGSVVCSAVRYVLLQIGIALDETVTSGDLEDLMAVFNCSEEVMVGVGGARTDQRGCPRLDMV